MCAAILPVPDVPGDFVASRPVERSRRREALRPVDNSRVERTTQKVGREIFRRIEKSSSGPAGLGLSRERVEKALMNVFMRDEELKYRLLRFVDVYPALRSDAAVAHHLQEYLEHESLSLPGVVGDQEPGLRRMARGIGRERAATRAAVAWASGFGIRTMGRQFIAGETPRDVAPRIRRLEERGFLFSLDLLGEFVASEAQADDYARRYRDMIGGLEGLLGGWPAKAARRNAGPRVNISIKLSSLTSKFDPMDVEGTANTVLARVRPLIREAKRAGSFVNIDMEKYEYRDMTLEIIRRLLSEEEFRGFPNLGTVVQAYLVDAEESLDEFLSWIREANQPITLRLVKGAYWDSEQIWARQKGWPVPVITNKRETDAQYERMTLRLLGEAPLVRTAIASHNVRSIAHSIAAARAMRVPRDAFELQMLFGMAGPIADAGRGLGLPVRVYVPTGELVPGMAYLVRRILENTSNESFLRQRFSEKRSVAALLADPKQG